MKKNLFLIVIIASILNANAQDTPKPEPELQRMMKIYYGGSVTQTIQISKIDSIKFISEDDWLSQLKDSTYTVGTVSFTMKYVRGGTFTMGCTAEQGSDCWDNESPTRNVTLSDYYLAETEVTQLLWETVMENNPSYYQERTNAAYANRENYPVEMVSWNNIVGVSGEIGYSINGVDYYKDGFCYKLSQLIGGGKQFRLPTEAEWEYAARGGSKAKTQTKYSGSDNLNNVAWYWNTILSQTPNTAGYGTQEVKTKQANALGIYDMSGNVFEWCSDWFENYSGESQTNPTGAESGSTKVLRGGIWSYDMPSYFRVSYRVNLGTNTNDLFFATGFRLAIDSD